MARQQELSDFIKKVHIDLRLSSRKFGAEAAWEEHCKNDDVLKKYAETMRNLATEHWDKNMISVQNVNRIKWIVNECLKYFSEQGQNEILTKEQKLAQRFGFNLEKVQNSYTNRKPLKLLDVGSCYNPFKDFEAFDVTAIDLAPATVDVLKCDFLDVEINDSLILSENTVISLPRQYFEVVVLCLLLEYLPHPTFRYNCCMKAYDILRTGGALLIVTPDSKHQSANSRLIKSWRIALADIGFLKYSYEKTEHLHCMCYTKSLNREIPRKWLKLKFSNINPKDMMIIPQDNVQYKTEILREDEVKELRCESDNKDIADNFSILAGDIIF